MSGKIERNSSVHQQGKIPVKSVVVVFLDDLRFLFIIWGIWFLKKMKLFRQFLMENFGGLLMSVFIRSFEIVLDMQSHVGFRRKATKATCVGHYFGISDNVF
jgi:hypothetical protein